VEVEVEVEVESADEFPSQKDSLTQKLQVSETGAPAASRGCRRCVQGTGESLYI